VPALLGGDHSEPLASAPVEIVFGVPERGGREGGRRSGVREGEKRRRERVGGGVIKRDERDGRCVSG
jgi:hypothetical protein